MTDEERWQEDAFRMRRTDQIMRARMYIDAAHRDIAEAMSLLRGITNPPHVPLTYEDRLELQSARVTIDSLMKEWDT